MGIMKKDKTIVSVMGTGNLSLLHVNRTAEPLVNNGIPYTVFNSPAGGGGQFGAFSFNPSLYRGSDVRSGGRLQKAFEADHEARVSVYTRDVLGMKMGCIPACGCYRKPPSWYQDPANLCSHADFVRHNGEGFHVT